MLNIDLFVTYTLAPAQIDSTSWVATATERTFHKGLFGMGETPELAIQSLAKTIRDALHGPAAAKRGWTPDRFTRVLLMNAVAYDLATLPES